jgi:hypothetical protein
VFDIPGAAPIAQTTYGGIHDLANSTISYGGRRQMAVDFRTPGNAAGVATAVTNQGSFTVSNTLPGTSSFMSGLMPPRRRSTTAASTTSATPTSPPTCPSARASRSM